MLETKAASNTSPGQERNIVSGVLDVLAPLPAASAQGTLLPLGLTAPPSTLSSFL